MAWTIRLVLLATVLSAVPASAQQRQVTVRWDANPATNRVTSYRVFVGTTSKAYNVITDVGLNTSYVLTIPDAFTRYIAIQARNAVGDSPLSIEVATGEAVPPPQPPCPVAARPTVAVETYTSQLKVGQFGRVITQVVSPTKRRIVLMYATLGTEKWAISGDVGLSAGLWYTPRVRGASNLVIFAVDDTSCVGRTSRIRTVRVQ